MALIIPLLSKMWILVTYLVQLINIFIIFATNSR